MESPDSEPRKQSPKARHRLWFGLLAMLLPTVIGGAAIIALLLQQERLVVKMNPFRIRFQSPPVYVEEPDHERSGQRYLFDAVLGWRNIPDYRATTFGKPMTINSRGLRDREYPYEKPPGTKRILVLGDSFTWGFGVGDSAIFTEDLERRLTANRESWEVLNAGVSGWGTDQEYLFLKNEGLRYSPDIVLLAFYLRNDPINNTALVQYGLGKPCFTTDNLDEFIAPRLNPGVTDEPAEGLDPLKTSVDLVMGIERLCRKNNSRLVFMTFGGFGEPDPQNSRAVRWMSERLTYELRLNMTETDLETVDIDGAFIGRKVTPESVFEGNFDRHWNAYGHGLVGEILHDHLRAHP